VEAEEVLTWLSRLSSRDRELAPLPERLCLACVAVTGADGGAITVEYTGQERMTLFATDWVAARLEDLQEVIGEGPGWDAHDEDEAVIGALGQTASWPSFTPAALQELGSVWVCAAPIRAAGGRIGVLTLYWAKTQPTDPDPSAVQFLADVVGAAFYQSTEEDLVEQLPWFSRVLIHQATGVVVAQLSVPVEDAMALLRANAYATGKDLNAVAEEVLSRELAFDSTHVGRGDIS